MKKILLILAILMPLVSFSQTKKGASHKKKATTTAVKTEAKPQKVTPSFTMPLFIFDSEGGLSTEDGKEFMVYELEGWSQKELYDKVVLGISQLFTYPDKVMTKVENELITVNGYESNAFKWGKGYYTSYYYTVKFLFKEGKIRVEPSIRGYEGNNGMANVAMWMRTQGNYNEVKPKFEESINALIYSFLLKSFDTSNDDW